MTKRDFRIRRGLFRQGQIRNRRDFESFQSDYQSHLKGGRLARIAVIVLIGLVLALTLYFIFSLK